jgi:uncharacterized protein
LKKILLISDTHSFLEPKLLKYIHECDEVWHAGDIGEGDLTTVIANIKPFKAVHGNIDSTAVRALFSEDLIFMCEGVKVFITHIGGYPGKLTAKLKERLQQERPNLFICGHSHILKVQYDKELGVLFMNPGACGNHGFHQVKTVLRFTIHQAKIDKKRNRKIMF